MIGILLALVIALLTVPLTVVFSIYRLENMEGYVRFHWLFGLVRFQVRIPQAAKVEPRPKLMPKKKPESPRRIRKGNTGAIVSLLKQSAFRWRVYKFVRDMLRAIHAQNLFIRLRIGLSDPADTGYLWAVIGPISGMVQNIQSAEILIEPEFMDPVFEVESHGQFRLVPIQFIVLMAVFTLSPTMLRAWRTLRQENA